MIVKSLQDGKLINKEIDLEQELGLTEPLPSGCVYEINGEYYLIRIRRLSARECGRLMDVDEQSIDNMINTCSKTQCYKAFGNSIVKNCLVAIFGQFFEGKENVYKERF